MGISVVLPPLEDSERLTRSRARVPTALKNTQMPKKAQDILTHLVSVLGFLQISEKREIEVLKEVFERHLTLTLVVYLDEGKRNDYVTYHVSYSHAMACNTTQTWGFRRFRAPCSSITMYRSNTYALRFSRE